MAGVDIQAKVRNGLAKAIKATGSSSSELVYLVVTSTTAISPLDTGVITSTETLLPNAIFKSFDKSIDGTNVLTGDRALVSDNAVIVKAGDIIKQGTDKYVIIDVEVKAPASEALAYISQVRLK